MNWKTRFDTYTPSQVKQIYSRNLLCNTGSSAGCFVITYRGGMGRVGGRFKRVGIHVHVWLTHFVLQHCKATTPQFKEEESTPHTVSLSPQNNVKAGGGCWASRENSHLFIWGIRGSAEAKGIPSPCPHSWLVLFTPQSPASP